MQGGAKPAENWLSENLGAGFSAESKVMDQVETVKGSGREDGREEVRAGNSPSDEVGYHPAPFL